MPEKTNCTEKTAMAEDVMFTPNLQKPENLGKLRVYCEEHGIGLVMLCLNIPESEALGLYAFLREADVFAEEDAL